MINVINTPWKVSLEIRRFLVFLFVRVYFGFNGISWNRGWKIYGRPILQRHLGSVIEIGQGLIARSWPAANPLAPDRPVVLSTRSKGAILRIGSNVGITGGTICAQESIEIGSNVYIGANSVITDTDFHPIDPVVRQ